MASSTPVTKHLGKTLAVWTPEDKAFWQQQGKAIATINLWISVPSLFLAFAVWQLWSAVAVNLPVLGFKFTPNELFWLAAAPGLSGATLRIFYSFMVPVFGGRRWTAISTASLLIPAIGIGIAVQDPKTSYATLLTLALLCGFGGGNFASSMANINFFFPKERKKPNDSICIIGGQPDEIEAFAQARSLYHVAHHQPPMGFVNDPEAFCAAY